MLYGLRNRRGETLIETLVSLAIAAISMLMFASMLAHTSRTAEIGQDWNNEINNINALLEQRKSGDGVKPVEGKITITSNDNSDLTLIEVDPVTFYVAEYVGEYVIAYD